MEILAKFYLNLYYNPKFDYHKSIAAIIVTALTIRTFIAFGVGLFFKLTSEISILPNFLKKILRLLKWATLLLGTVLLAAIPPVLQGFHVISLPTCLLLCSLIYLKYFISFVLRYNSTKKEKSDEDDKRHPVGIQKRLQIFKLAFMRSPKAYILMLFAFAVLTFGKTLVLDELCLCFFCDFGFILMSEADRISSRLLRQYYLPDACPPGPPCHVYNTLPEDGSKAVFINAHTSVSTEDINIYYNILSEYNKTGNLNSKAIPTSHKLDIEAKGARNVHSAYLDGLNPNTEYYFEIHYGENNKEAQYKNIFRTLPSKNMEKNIVVVSGGDVSANANAQRMTKNLAAVRPDAIFIDGDAAYDDGMRSCFHCWDLFINMFEDLNKELGYMVPLVLSIGNHDIGFNAPNEVKPAPIHDGPLYFTYFPQHTTKGDELKEHPDVPAIEERRTYFHHIIGDSLHISLDSAYNLDFGGSQAAWLDKLSAAYPNHPKYAHYHVPLYPVCEEEEDMTTEQREEGVRAWTHIFEKYKYKLIFENHLHLMKKTHPLKGGKVDPDGIVYVGDGSWGVPSRHDKGCGKVLDRAIFERSGNESHVWVLNSSKKGYEYYPLGIDGKKIMESEYKIY